MSGIIEADRNHIHAATIAMRRRAWSTAGVGVKLGWWVKLEVEFTRRPVVPLKPGNVLSHFRLIERVGAGGMGVVWKAEDTVLGRVVALKVLPEGVSRNPHSLARFGQEARLLAALNHPNIATIHGLDQADEVSMLVMEYVEGQTISQHLAALGPWKFDQALPLFEQMAEALQDAHEAGIIHRDLKPDNIKVTPAGKVKILDFGLAKAYSSDTAIPASQDSPTVEVSLTQSGVAVGTAIYMSPEQMAGLTLDGRSDLFQLGMVFCQMLTGRHPFEGPTPFDIQHAILRSVPSVVPTPEQAPQDFSRILGKLLEKSLEYRYPDARALLVDLRTLKRNTSSESALPSVLDSRLNPLSVASHSFARRRPFTAAVGAVLVLAGIALGVTGLLHLLAPRPVPSPVPSRLVPLLDVGGNAMNASFSPDSKSVVFASDRGGNWDLWIALVSGGDPVQITDTPEIETGPTWSPDGSTVAFEKQRLDGQATDLFLMPALGGEARKIIENASDPAWSPNGQWIAFADASTGWSSIAKVSPDDPGKLVPVTEPEEGFFHRRPCWSRDGREIVYSRSAGGASGQLWRVPSAGGEPAPITDPSDGSANNSPSITPDGRYIVYASDRGGATNLWRIPVDGGRPERVTSGPGPDEQPRVSPDGTKIVFINSTTTPSIIAVPAGGTEATTLAEFEGGIVWGVDLSPDSSRIAFCRKVAGRPWEVLVMPRQGGRSRRVFVTDQNVMWPRFDATGESVFFFTWEPGSQRIGRVGLELADVTWLTPEREEASYPAPSPDGRSLAFVRASEDGEDVVVRFADGDEKVVVENATLPVFSPDGSMVAVAQTRSYLGGIGVARLDGSGARWLTETGTWPTWMPSGRTIAYADALPDGRQEARVVAVDGGASSRLGEFVWNQSHHPFEIDPATGQLITTEGVGGKSTIWLAEYDRE